MKKTELYGYVYDFTFDYRATAADKILDIHKSLMEKNNIMQKGLDLLKKCFFL